MPSFVLWMLAGLVTAQVSLFLTSIYLHRTETHRSVEASVPFRWFARVWLFFTTGVARRDWVTVHSAHHRYVETDRDPHSPANAGLGGVLFGTAFLYRRALKHLDVDEWTRHIPADRFDRFSERFGFIGPIAAVAGLVVVFGVVPGLWWSAAHAVVYLLGGGLVNGLGHQAVGGGDVEPRDSLLASVWSAGEGNHEYHHEVPTSAHFRGPFPDTAWMAIKALASVRLVTVRRVGAGAGR